MCLNILRDEWMPVLSIQSVVYGLQYLFLVRPAARRRRTNQHTVLTTHDAVVRGGGRRAAHAGTQRG